MPILRPLASAGKRACWLLMGLCLGLPALANEAPVSFNGTSISLEQALERALRSNPELAAVGRETEIASGARQQAGLIPNPDLSGRRGHPPRQSPDQRQHRPAAGAGRQARCAGGGGETRQRDRLDPTGSPSRRTARPGPRRLLRGADRAGAGAPGEDLPGPGQGARCRPPTDGSRPAASPRWNGFAPRSRRTTPSST